MTIAFTHHTDPAATAAARNSFAAAFTKSETGGQELRDYARNGVTGPGTLNHARLVAKDLLAAFKAANALAESIQDAENAHHREQVAADRQAHPYFYNSTGRLV